MFWLQLALKKLVMNLRRTLTKVAFFGILFSVIFTLVSFLEGSNEQMQQSMKQFLGDASAVVRDMDYDISPLYNDIESGVFGDDVFCFPYYADNIKISTNRSTVASQCYGSPDILFSRVNKVVSWRDDVPSAVDHRRIYLEASVADSISCNIGDTVTIQWSNSQGRANSLQVEIGGIFIGSSLLFKGISFLNIVDMHELIVDDTKLNRLGIYFDIEDPSAIREILLEINESYYNLAQFSSVTLDPTGGIFGVYRYYNLLVSFILWAIIVMFYFIMYYSNQNVFFAEYRRRRPELITFLTYGMRPGQIRWLVALEAVIQAIMSLIVAIAFSEIIMKLAGLFRITSVQYADIITALGGPRILFVFNGLKLTIVYLVMLAIMLYSALKGANRYLMSEIRDIAGTIE